MKWLPAPNAPILLKSTADFVASSNAVGHFPGTNYPVSIKSIDELVTHNTAILGILGVGKSMLAIELVERMMAAGVKVICLDLTDQYSQELATYYDQAYEEGCLAKIQEAGEKDREAWADNPEEGGSIPSLRDAFQADLFDFLSDENPRLLKIYNPSQVVGSKQLSEPKQFQTQGKWQRGAALWGVTPVEVTRIVSETALSLLQDKMSSKARVCLVYEEAHSLIPEFSAVASPSDREASNGTARAILQGRKFGLGCLVVTQRTANVTKTILNQCNTVFAMRTFDETGKEFLANYIGKDSRPKRGLVAITDDGKKLIGTKPDHIDNKVLATYPSYVERVINAKSTSNGDTTAQDSSSESTNTEATKTPDERMEAAFVELQNILTTELLDQLSKVDPFRFEQIVLDLLVAMGYGGSRMEAAEVTQKTNDEGIDGVIKEDRLGLDVIYIQAKRWKSNVGRQEIQSFVGALAGKKANKGIFITTSDFNSNAIEYAAGLHQKVILIGGRRLAELMIDHNIGVSEERVYRAKRIDSDYFDTGEI